MWLQEETEWVNWKESIIRIQILNFEHNFDKETLIELTLKYI